MRIFRLWHIGAAILLMKLALIAYLLISVLPTFALSDLVPDHTFFLFMLVGFVAQMVDGTLGMAYGVSCTALLLNLGITPRVASAAVHTAEVFTTGVSGLSHLGFKNIDKSLFLRLVFPGVIGAALGAYFLAEMVNGKVVKPFIALYLLILGFVILYRGIRNRPKNFTRVKNAGILALLGGFFDAVGGGGWGPIVTSNIIHQGNSPKETIGTVNTTEFFVAYVCTGVFLWFVGVDSWPIVLGLILGGVIAAPIGAYLTHKVNKRLLMIMVGAVVVLTSAYTLYSVWFV